MAHNPGRPTHLDSASVQRVADSIRPQQPYSETRSWRDAADLAVKLAYRARLGRNVVLSPATAAVVAEHLRTASAKPTRDEVALLICRLGEMNRCREPCTACKATANVVVNVYGRRLDPFPATEK